MIARLGAAVATLAALGCAAGAPSDAPIVDLEPMAAQPATAPYEWFLENWGPFDPALNRNADGWVQTMLIVDGRQVDQRREPGDPGGSPLGGLTEDDIRNIQVLVCDALDFGVAESGVILIFTHDYTGPMPLADRTYSAEECRRGDP